ncbi:MAG: hypothetical protein HY823_11170 [Acidobacteria bacterium]|nr:hypothetical protein [Acidobacteriota bacterium]
MHSPSRLLLAAALLLPGAPGLRAQSTTHLNVPSANMVLLQGRNSPTGTNWSALVNGTWSYTFGGHFVIPTGKTLVITDLRWYASGTATAGALYHLALFGGPSAGQDIYHQFVTMTGDLATFSDSFLTGYRFPAGNALEVSVSAVSGKAPNNWCVTLLGYYTN